MAQKKWREKKTPEEMKSRNQKKREKKKAETHRDLDLVRDEGDNACTKTVFRCSSHTRSDATVF